MLPFSLMPLSAYVTILSLGVIVLGAYKFGRAKY
jgi:hypothetical protein